VSNEQVDAEREARRRVALAQIRQYPEAALRLEARPVESFDDDLRRLVERMTRLMHDAIGVGLAATQVGTLQRLFVFHREDGEDVAVVNPESERARGNGGRRQKVLAAGRDGGRTRRR
jgi:peptide deformylase